MANIVHIKILFRFCVVVAGGWTAFAVSSCGKEATASKTGLNIQYEILNLSPDLRPVNLFIDFKQVNITGNISNPFVFNVNHGYFYVPSVDIPYQIRTDSLSQNTIFSRNDSLKTGLKYSLFITGTNSDGALKQIFTVDTATSPAVGRGKIRFVNASPTGLSGLDLFANGVPAFTKVTYPNFSKFIEVPVGNYDIQINTTGSKTVLKDLGAVTVLDGKLYTIYAFGYTTRTDTAAFNAGVITNR